MGCKVLEHLFQEGHCAFRRTAVGIGRVDLKSVSGFHCDGRGKEAPIFQKSFLEGPATDPQRLRAADHGIYMERVPEEVSISVFYAWIRISLTGWTRYKNYGKSNLCMACR